MVVFPHIHHTFPEHMRCGSMALGEAEMQETKTATVRFPRGGRHAKIRVVR